MFGIVGAALGAVVVAGIVFLFVAARPYRIPSSAMEPTLHCARPAPGCEGGSQDRILVLKWIGFGRGDIVVFHTPPEAEVRCGAGGTFVKRLIGLPGEVVSERDGYVYINSHQLDEPYLKPGRRDHEPPRTWPRIPAGHYFLLGDNRAQSCDSRVWGTVPRQNIVGKVAVLYWPPSRFGFR
jgi:signal peptidase I